MLQHSHIWKLIPHSGDTGSKINKYKKSKKYWNTGGKKVGSHLWCSWHLARKRPPGRWNTVNRRQQTAPHSNWWIPCHCWSWWHSSEAVECHTALHTDCGMLLPPGLSDLGWWCHSHPPDTQRVLLYIHEHLSSNSSRDNPQALHNGN